VPAFLAGTATLLSALPTFFCEDGKGSVCFAANSLNKGVSLTEEFPDKRSYELD